MHRRCPFVLAECEETHAMYSVSPNKAYVFEPVWQDALCAARAERVLQAIAAPEVVTITDRDLPGIIQDNHWVNIPARGKVVQRSEYPI